MEWSMVVPSLDELPGTTWTIHATHAVKSFGGKSKRVVLFERALRPCPMTICMSTLHVWDQPRGIVSVSLLDGTSIVERVDVGTAKELGETNAIRNRTGARGGDSRGEEEIIAGDEGIARAADFDSSIDERLSPIDLSIDQRLSPIDSSAVEQLSTIESSAIERSSPIDSSAVERLSAIDSSAVERLSPIESRTDQGVEGLSLIHSTSNQGIESLSSVDSSDSHELQGLVRIPDVEKLSPINSTSDKGRDGLLPIELSSNQGDAIERVAQMESPSQGNDAQKPTESDLEVYKLSTDDLGRTLRLHTRTRIFLFDMQAHRFVDLPPATAEQDSLESILRSAVRCGQLETTCLNNGWVFNEYEFQLIRLELAIASRDETTARDLLNSRSLKSVMGTIVTASTPSPVNVVDKLAQTIMAQTHFFLGNPLLLSQMTRLLVHVIQTHHADRMICAKALSTLRNPSFPSHMHASSGEEVKLDDEQVAREVVRRAIPNSMWGRWSKMSDYSAATDALKTGNTSRVCAFLHARGVSLDPPRLNEFSKTQTQDAFEFVVRVAEHNAARALCDFDRAKFFIDAVGQDFESFLLHRIAMVTTNRKLRKNVLAHLKLCMPQVSSKVRLELGNVAFAETWLNRLERLWPGKSPEVASQRAWTQSVASKDRWCSFSSIFTMAENGQLTDDLLPVARRSRWPPTCVVFEDVCGIIPEWRNAVSAILEQDKPLKCEFIEMPRRPLSTMESTIRSLLTRSSISRDEIADEDHVSISATCEICIQRANFERFQWETKAEPAVGRLAIKKFADSRLDPFLGFCCLSLNDVVSAGEEARFRVMMEAGEHVDLNSAFALGYLADHNDWRGVQLWFENHPLADLDLIQSVWSKASPIIRDVMCEFPDLVFPRKTDATIAADRMRGFAKAQRLFDEVASDPQIARFTIQSCIENGLLDAFSILFRFDQKSCMDIVELMLSQDQQHSSKSFPYAPVCLAYAYCELASQKSGRERDKFLLHAALVSHGMSLSVDDVVASTDSRDAMKTLLGLIALSDDSLSILSPIRMKDLKAMTHSWPELIQALNPTASGKNKLSSSLLLPDEADVITAMRRYFDVEVSTVAEIHAPGLQDESRGGGVIALTPEYYLSRRRAVTAFTRFSASDDHPAEQAILLARKIALLHTHDTTVVETCVRFLELNLIPPRERDMLKVDCLALSKILAHESSMESRDLYDLFLSLTSTETGSVYTNDVTPPRPNAALVALHALLQACDEDDVKDEESLRLISRFCLMHRLPPSLALLNETSKRGDVLGMLRDADDQGLSRNTLIGFVENSSLVEPLKEHVLASLNSPITIRHPLIDALRQGPTCLMEVAVKSKRPLYAAAATCFAEASVDDCWRAWLIASLGMERKPLRFEEGGKDDLRYLLLRCFSNLQHTKELLIHSSKAFFCKRELLARFVQFRVSSVGDLNATVLDDIFKTSDVSDATYEEDFELASSALIAWINESVDVQECLTVLRVISTSKSFSTPELIIQSQEWEFLAMSERYSLEQMRNATSFSSFERGGLAAFFAHRDEYSKTFKLLNTVYCNHPDRQELLSSFATKEANVYLSKYASVRESSSTVRACYHACNARFKSIACPKSGITSFFFLLLQKELVPRNRATLAAILSEWSLSLSFASTIDALALAEQIGMDVASLVFEVDDVRTNAQIEAAGVTLVDWCLGDIQWERAKSASLALRGAGSELISICQHVLDDASEGRRRGHGEQHVRLGMDLPNGICTFAHHVHAIEAAADKVNIAFDESYLNNVSPLIRAAMEKRLDLDTIRNMVVQILFEQSSSAMERLISFDESSYGKSDTMASWIRVLLFDCPPDERRYDFLQDLFPPRRSQTRRLVVKFIPPQIDEEDCHDPHVLSLGWDCARFSGVNSRCRRIFMKIEGFLLNAPFVDALKFIEWTMDYDWWEMVFRRAKRENFVRDMDLFLRDECSSVVRGRAAPIVKRVFFQDPREIGSPGMSFHFEQYVRLGMTVGLSQDVARMMESRGTSWQGELRRDLKLVLQCFIESRRLYEVCGDREGFVRTDGSVNECWAKLQRGDDQEFDVADASFSESFVVSSVSGGDTSGLSG